MTEWSVRWYYYYVKQSIETIIMSYMGKNTSLKAKKIIEQENICSLSILSQFVFFFS